MPRFKRDEQSIKRYVPTQQQSETSTNLMVMKELIKNTYLFYLHTSNVLEHTRSSDCSHKPPRKFNKIIATDTKSSDR